MLLQQTAACGTKGTADASGPSTAPTAPPIEASIQSGPSEDDHTALSSNNEVGKTVLAAMDLSVNPCDDFYRYACGSWLDATELPADKPRFGRGFSELAERNNQLLKQIVSGSSVGADPKVASFYATCNDVAAVNRAGMSPLTPTLEAIDGLRNLRAVLDFVGKHRGGLFGGALFGFHLSNDAKDPDLYVADLGQGGLGLPDRAYYLEAAKAPVLEAYSQHVARMLVLAGVAQSEAAERAAGIVAFEKEIAALHIPRAELRDPLKRYNRVTAKALRKLAAGIDWKRHFKAMGREKIDEINLSVPSFIESLPALLRSTKAAVLRDYLRFHAVNGAADLLSEEAAQTKFAFTASLTGAKQLAPRWKRCLKATTSAFPDLVGKSFVEANFAGESRNIAVQMIEDIEAAFAAGLPGLTWMDETTRGRALEKMHAVNNKIGYPTKWRDYSGITLGSSHFENVLAAQRNEFQQDLGKIGGRVDPEEWFWPASIVNAAYDPSQNEMIFPAGILQPPFFSAAYPRAMNYGAMGMVMGHELTHGFDDAGRKFDGQGVMHEWWQPEVTQRFEEKASCIEKTYAEIEVQPGVKLNGKLTLGENIADFGGIKETVDAYASWVKKNGAETQVINNMPNEQLLFVAFAQSWCTKATPEYEKLAAAVDPHSPPKFRVNVPLAHLPAFWETFSCGDGTAMHAANACGVW